MADKTETTQRESTRSYAGSRGVPTRSRYREGEIPSSSGLERIRSWPRYQSPFALMRRLADDMDSFFNDFGFSSRSLTGSDLFTGGSNLEQSIWAPEIETFRRGDNLVIHADLPGMNKDNVKIEVDDDNLILTGERKDEYREERDEYYRTERSYGRFYRAVPLPDDVDPNDVHAQFSDGVLEVTVKLPKETETKRRQIEIK